MTPPLHWFGSLLRPTTARLADDRERFIPSTGTFDRRWLGYRPEPVRLGDRRPEPADLDRHGFCWWWYGQAWVLRPPGEVFGPDRLWLPYQAIAEPQP